MTSSVVNMEQQILRIVSCTQPYEVKRTLIQYCCKTSLQHMENEACYSILKLAIQWILDDSEALLAESGRMMLMSVTENKTLAVVSFFDENMLLSLLQRRIFRPSALLDIFICVFPYLKSSSKVYPQLCKVLRDHITLLFKLNDTVEYYGRLIEFLTSFADCVPGGKEDLLAINHLLIQCLGKSKTPKVPKDEMIEYFKTVSSVCEFLQVIWRKDPSHTFVELSVKECFEILSNPEYQSTVALANLTNYVPDDVINPMIYEVTTSSNIPDQELTVGISKMVQWLVWPKKTKVLQWLMTFFKCLVKAEKRNILENVILNRILQVFSRVFMPVVRESNFVVLVNMLLNSLHSPKAFHMIIPFVPSLMDRLRSEKTEKSSNHLKALGELMYTMMHRFPDHGALYEALLLALKDVPKPSSEKMDSWLQSADHSYTTDENKGTAPRFFTPEVAALMKGSRKTGLVNLGNTCYMNSILQCLLMLDVFRHDLMSRHVSPTRHPIMYSLQDLFTFLVLSKRDAIEPERFVSQSRPPWFPSRTQQDCCEFVHYMMDRLEEEDKSLLQDEREPSNIRNIVEENFKGVLRVTYKCLKCGNESQHEEAFTDIQLAFPDQHPAGVNDSESTAAVKTEKRLDETRDQNPKSLKGGNQIRKFQEPRVFTDESFESSTESVPSMDTPNTQKNASATSVTNLDPERLTFTVHEMLDYFMKPEKLSGNNQYFCDECRENVDGERCVQIRELPKYLMLVFKRFSFDIRLQTKPKLLHIVEYPEELTFFSVEGSIKSAHSNSKDLSSSTCKESELQQQDFAKEEWDDQAMDTSKSSYSYKLCSVVVHSGRTCEAGHYYSYALDTQSKGRVGMTQWYCFNDELTDETSYKEFMEGEKRLLKDTTYILIYDQLLEAGQAGSDGNLEFVAPAEMVERVRLDDIKYCQERNRLATTSQTKERVRTQFDDDDRDDKSPPPGNCGSNGSNFSVPGNRFIF